MTSKARGDRVLSGGAHLEADDARLGLATAVAEARSEGVELVLGQVGVAHG